MLTLEQAIAAIKALEAEPEVLEQALNACAKISNLDPATRDTIDFIDDAVARYAKLAPEPAELIYFGVSFAAFITAFSVKPGQAEAACGIAISTFLKQFHAVYRSSQEQEDKKELSKPKFRAKNSPDLN